MLVGFVVLEGLALWNQQCLWESAQTLRIRPHALQPVSALTVLAAFPPLLNQAWRSYGVSRGQRWAFLLSASTAGYGLARSVANLENIRLVLTETSAPRLTSALVLFWVGGCVNLAILGYALGRLVKLFGPRVGTPENARPLVLDRVAGALVAIGFLLFGLWDLSGTYQSMIEYARMGSPESLATHVGLFGMDVLTAAVGIIYGIGLFQGQRWAFVVAVLSNLSLLLMFAQRTEIVPALPDIVFRGLILVYGAVRLLVGPKPPIVASLPTAPTE